MDSPLQPESQPLRFARMLGNRWLVLLPLLYIVFQFLSVYFGSEGLFERDGYYHARFANLLPTFGLSRDFHWTQCSTWNGQFCDKEFLFHVLMVPFTLNSDEPIIGAKVFAALLGTGVFVALYLVLRAHSARLPVLFAILPLCFGSTFLMRVLMLRSHVLSMILLLIGMHFMLKQKWKALAVMGFVYAWSYTFPLLLVMTAVPFSAGRWLIDRKLDWKCPLAALCGVIAGLVIHPYSPNTLETFITYIQVVISGASGPARNIELGYEIYSMQWGEMLTHMPVYCAVWAAVLIAAVVCRTKISGAGMGALFAAIFWHGMTLVYARFTEYAAPLLALAAGLVCRDLLAEVNLAVVFEKFQQRVAASAMVVVLGLAAGHAFTMYEVNVMSANQPPPLYRGAKKWMEQNLNPGDTVAHLWWEDFRDLYYDCYRQNFLWGLDPTYTIRKDPQVAMNLELMRKRMARINPHWIAGQLKARVLVMLQANALQHPELTSSQWKPVYADAFAVIFALEGPHGPPETFEITPRAKPLHAFPTVDMPLNDRNGAAQ